MSAEHKILRKCHWKGWLGIMAWVVGSQPSEALKLLNILWVQETFENMLRAYTLSPEKCSNIEKLSQKKFQYSCFTWGIATHHLFHKEQYHFSYICCGAHQPSFLQVCPRNALIICIYKSSLILYTLNIYNFICQLYLSNARGIKSTVLWKLLSLNINNVIQVLSI